MMKMKKEEPHTEGGGERIRNIVLGLNDGLVSNLALVAGITGGVSSSYLVVLGGIAGLLAGAVSMFFSVYISVKSEKEHYDKEEKREYWEIDNLRHREVQEVKDALEKWGFKGKQLKDGIKTITENNKRWVDFMMIEELGLMKDRDESPLKLGSWTFISFVAAAVIPILAYLFLPIQQAFPTAILLSAAFLFIFGAGRSMVTERSWYYSGFEMLAIGLTATGVTYSIGTLFAKYFPGLAGVV